MAQPDHYYTLTIDYVNGRTGWFGNGRHTCIVARVVDRGSADFQSVK